MLKLVLDNVCVDYTNHRAVDGISFGLNSGEVISLIGPNGSGKSTLIKSIARIFKPTSGSILIDGRNVSTISLKEAALMMGYVPQSFPQANHSTVIDTVLLGRKPHINWSVSRKDIEIVEDALAIMGIKDLAHKLMGRISGGERQRAYIARALAQDPQLFLFDEPTNSLDLKNQLEVLETARALTHERKSAVILALHDLNLAYNYSDRVVMLKSGRVHACGTPGEVLTAKNIKDVYGVNVSILDNSFGKYIVPLKVCGKASVKAIA